ncbi:hypothetical protein AVEN_187034-1 [Araneus ventricosus]|uniref:Integrase catalytic domain-containing protein n=1 Tax=Araneus ventricosus TaxID=182803 RepID=A0A4Y2HBG4_ARAVE|nr:hypothetical protein AVEN_187034-1 [Araneus ventricosus]
MVERVHRTILSTIVTSMEKNDQRDWDSKIKETERNLNNTVNKTLGKTPFEVLHGYVPRFKDGFLRLLADEEHEVWNDPEKLQLEAREKISKGKGKHITIKRNLEHYYLIREKSW